jgi:hypothetical protein
MRRIIPILLVLGSAAGARAQGYCNGMLQGTTHLAISDGAGGFHRLASLEVDRAFGMAECDCDTSDYDIEIALTASQVPSGGVAEIWVGEGCDDLAKRTGAANATCEKIATPSIQDFTATGSHHYALSSRAVYSPLRHDCSATGGHNSVYVVLYNDPALPLATCTMPLTQDLTPPPGPTDVRAQWLANGDLELRWTPSADKAQYEVYLATDDGQPAGEAVPVVQTAISMCLPGQRMLRRGLIPEGGGPLVGALAPATTLEDPLAWTLRFDFGSAPTEGVGTITGLSAKRGYRLSLVAYDQYGNAAPSPVLAIAPSATPSQHSGGCSVGGGAREPAPLALALLLVVVGAIVARGRRHAR